MTAKSLTEISSIIKSLEQTLANIVNTHDILYPPPEKQKVILPGLNDIIATSAVIDSYTKNDKHYAKFFLLNGEQNLNRWEVTPASIPEFMKTFIGMPFTDDPSEGHFGIEKNTPINEILTMQEKYRKGTIVSVTFNPKKIQAIAVIHITNDELWQKIITGEKIHVSPAITGRPLVMTDGSKIYDVWYGLHLARVKNPAYGVHHASLQETCSGPEKKCVNQLTAMASQHNVSFKPFATTQCSSKMDTKNTAPEEKEKENDTAAKLTQAIAHLRTDLARVKTDLAESLNIQQKSKIPEGEKQVPGKAEDDDKKTSDNKNNDNENTKKLEGKVASLEAKLAEKEEVEKKEIAQEIVDLMIKDEVASETDKDEETDNLMKNDKAALAEKLAFAKKYHDTAAAKSEKAGLASKPGRTISYASTDDNTNNNKINFEDVMRLLPQ